MRGVLLLVDPSVSTPLKMRGAGSGLGRRTVGWAQWHEQAPILLACRAVRKRATIDPLAQLIFVVLTFRNDAGVRPPSCLRTERLLDPSAEEGAQIDDTAGLMRLRNQSPSARTLTLLVREAPCR